MTVRQPGRPEIWTRTLIVDAVRHWHEQTGSVSSVQYSSDSLGNPNLPTMSTIRDKGFRSWKKMLAEIGAQPDGSGGWSRIAEWDRDTVIAAVRDWYDETGETSSVRYAGDAVTDPNLPSVAVATARCGPSWENVLRAAGVIGPGEGVPERWTSEACINAVRAWRTETGSVSSNDYREACRGNRGLPSLPTLAAKTGMTWRQLIAHVDGRDAVA